MRICLVTTRHVSYNPRVVKEADALAEAGHEVTAVAVRNHHDLAPLDEQLLAGKAWRLTTVDYRRAAGREWLRWLWTGCRQKLFRDVLSRLTMAGGVAERAIGREHVELCRLAARQEADLYIAHHAEALGAAAGAASRRGAEFAFDAEDFHTGQFAAGEAPHLARLIEYVEAKYLPQCRYVTAASEGIAAALAEKYPLDPPQVVLNTFPLEPLPDRESERSGQEPSLYWYSQVIGPGRGLEDAARALGRLSRPCQLHLRGTLLDGFADTLERLAQEGGFTGEIVYHQPAPPDQLVALAAEHDIGLALETNDDPNRLICVTNKLFVYMLAGLALLATDTPGQQGIMDQAPDAGATCRMSDPDSLAQAIEALIGEPDKLASAQAASRQAAERLFNWDLEKQKLLRAVEAAAAPEEA